MITKKEFRIINGVDEEIQDELNKLNNQGTVNIIAFNTVQQRDVNNHNEIVYNVHSIVLHVGPFKHERLEKITIDKEIEVLDFVKITDLGGLYIVVELRGDDCVVYNIFRGFKTTTESEYVTILSIDEAVELFNNALKH